MSSRKPSTLSTSSAFFPTASSPLDDSHGLSSATVSWGEKKEISFFLSYTRAQREPWNLFNHFFSLGRSFGNKHGFEGLCVFFPGEGKLTFLTSFLSNSFFMLASSITASPAPPVVLAFFAPRTERSSVRPAAERLVEAEEEAIGRFSFSQAACWVSSSIPHSVA